MSSFLKETLTQEYWAILFGLFLQSYQNSLNVKMLVGRGLSPKMLLEQTQNNWAKLRELCKELERTVHILARVKLRMLLQPGCLHICMCVLPFHFPGRPIGILSVDGQMHRWTKKVLGTAKLSVPVDAAVSIFCDKILCLSANTWQNEADLQNQHRPNIQLNFFSRWLALFLQILWLD